MVKVIKKIAQIVLVRIGKIIVLSNNCCYVVRTWLL